MEQQVEGLSDHGCRLLRAGPGEQRHVAGQVPHEQQAGVPPVDEAGAAGEVGGPDGSGVRPHELLEEKGATDRVPQALEPGPWHLGEDGLEGWHAHRAAVRLEELGDLQFDGRVHRRRRAPTVGGVQRAGTPGVGP